MKFSGKVILSLSSFLIGILLVELSLQAYGTFLDYQRFQLEPNLAGKIRILALGESTTDPIFQPGMKTWTNFLEEHLNKNHHPKSFSVINKGRSGIYSDQIIKVLPAHLENYQPHLVIVMMGLNDDKQLSYLHEESWFSRLKLVRLIRSKMAGDLNNDERVSHKAWKLISRINSPGELQEEIQEFSKQYPQQEWIIHSLLSERYLKLSEQMAGEKKRDIKRKAFLLAQEGLRINPLDKSAPDHLLNSAIGDEQLTRECRSILKDALKKGLIPTWKISTLLHQIQYESDPELVSLLSRIGIEKITKSRIEKTRENFKTLEKLVRKSGARLAVMAYPTIQLDLFKHLFTDYKFSERSLRDHMHIRLPPAVIPAEFKHIYFIANSNFPFAFDKGIYLDMMVTEPALKVGFGHTTMKGHELIGKNAAEVLSREWVPQLIPE